MILRERVKAGVGLAKVIESKYGLTKRSLGGDDKTETIDFKSIIQAAYGPVARIQPKMEKEDPLGLLGKPGGQ